MYVPGRALERADHGISGEEGSLALNRYEPYVIKMQKCSRCVPKSKAIDFGQLTVNMRRCALLARRCLFDLVHLTIKTRFLANARLLLNRSEDVLQGPVVYMSTLFVLP
jgi:hypothetical protein